MRIRYSPIGLLTNEAGRHGQATPLTVRRSSKFRMEKFDFYYEYVILPLNRLTVGFDSHEVRSTLVG